MFDHIRHIADVMIPGFLRDINCLMDFHVIALIPALDIVLVHAQAGTARAVNNHQLGEVRPVFGVLDVLGERVQR